MMLIIMAWIMAALAEVGGAPRCPNCVCCLASVCRAAAAGSKTCIEVDAGEARHLGCPCCYQWERLR